MHLEHLGWGPLWAQHFSEYAAADVFAARIVDEGRGALYRALGESGETRARLSGRARHQALDTKDRPAVGDWVAVVQRAHTDVATVLATLPRRSALLRQAAGTARVAQVLATNMDYVLIMSSLNGDLNLRRLERSLALAYESGAQPVVVLSKSDLASGTEELALGELTATVPVHRVSVVTGEGLERLRSLLGIGRTAVLMGSSGVGKSSLINALVGSARLRVGAIRATDDRGRHTTTSRHLIELPGGGMIIDTPGLRELQLWIQGEGLAAAFGDLADVAVHCRFRDCTHRTEPGCAVREAIADGALDADRLAHHHKLAAELRYGAARDDIRLQLDRKRHSKRLCKALKDSQRWRGDR